MIRLQINHLLEIFENIVCLCLMCLGFYFLHLGEVFDKYWLERTNFASHDESVSQLPTVFTYIHYHNLAIDNEWSGLSYGIDLNISYQVFGSLKATVLTPGENNIKGSPLILQFEVQNEFPRYQNSSVKSRQVRIVQAYFGITRSLNLLQ